MNDEYLLTTPMAKQLYTEVARDLPLIDYHNHLTVKDLTDDRVFQDIAELWVISDPYKHRAMRICGVDETLITGDADHKAKFRAWCETYPKLMGTPLYDWSRMELQEVFGISTEINGENADQIWDEANALLKTPKFSAHGLFNHFHVEYAAPCASLTDDFSGFSCVEGLAPSLRGDDLLVPTVELIQKLEKKSGIAVNNLDSFRQAISSCLDQIAAVNCRFADHALDNGFTYVPDDDGFEQRLMKVLNSETLTDHDRTALTSDMLRLLGEEYAKRRFVLQLHIGAQRFTSSTLRRIAGPAGGFAGIGNSVDVVSLVNLLDDLEKGPHGLPRTILFTLNPADNALFATLSGSFRGVTQGPAWWWCDHLQGMRDMLETFTTHSVLSTFVGMTTDSRSLLSLLRHDYFRRMFCGWAGEKAERGELPNCFEKLAELVTAVCYGNAKKLI